MTESNSSAPLLTLWYKPGKTLQGLIASGKGRAEALVITCLFGLVQGWRFYSASEESGPGVLVVAAAVAVAMLYLYGWLLRNFGRWFGGTAQQVDLRTALGWGLLPWLVLFGGLAGLMGQAGDAAQLAAFYPIFFGAFVYGYIILLLALSVALNISVLKTFLCLVVTCLVSLFPLTLVLQIVVGPVAPAQ